MQQSRAALMRLTISASIVLMLLSAPSANGGLVQAGQTTSLNSIDFAPPTGTLLDQRTTVFAVPYGDPQPSIGFGGQLAGTLHSAVYRDAGGTLSFLYDIDLAQTSGVSAAEASRLEVRSFSAFTTNISGALDFEELIAAKRTADGSRLSVFSDSPGLGGAPMLLVRTNATSFDAAGTAAFSASDEVSLLDGSSRLVTGSATIDGILEPMAGIGPVTPPVSIPLPPAFYSGVGVLLAMGLIVSTRRAGTRS